MDREKFINPTKEQFKQLMALDYKGPIMMINLLKFKKEGGREAYAKYGEGLQESFENIGGQATKRGDALMTVIGDEEWNEVLVAEYPSIDAFIEMQRDRKYQAAVPYRDEAIEDSRLIAVRADQQPVI
ncbi:MAG: DUF1330 domain-containing protein [Deltaproteobacteria bacterium]|jgi:uncharacterized protein (DUF1330 family)|nr:DUF1330 domain-containing protein [Deltaproteobacteria bacterium]MBT4640876.1 DUF1330 domain-containing protein [Deltaproteobacteria bacterium]MBT6503179.1 DUF1330 domain-containing protein [Deltaproteobacteria bacterium]MBT7155896.1 DUF1330 domain-containing protein [Deltaproteobacteria bacterium]MBT7711686.1 DUF1330 domain-containing protein [Deltaproteobacteria bacterium]